MSTYSLFVGDDLMSNVIYPKKFFIEDTAENWENGSLGCDERFVKAADDSINDLIDEAARNGKIKWEDDDEH